MHKISNRTRGKSKKLTFLKGNETIENVMILQNGRMYLIQDSPDTAGAEWEDNIEILI